MNREILNFEGVEFILNYADESYNGKLEKGKCQGIISVSYVPKTRERELQSVRIFHENEPAIIQAIIRVTEANKSFYDQFDFDLYFNHSYWNGYRDDFGNAYTGSITKEIKIDLKK